MFKGSDALVYTNPLKLCVFFSEKLSLFSHLGAFRIDSGAKQFETICLWSRSLVCRLAKQLKSIFEQPVEIYSLSDIQLAVFPPPQRWSHKKGQPGANSCYTTQISMTTQKRPGESMPVMGLFEIRKSLYPLPVDSHLKEDLLCSFSMCIILFWGGLLE